MVATHVTLFAPVRVEPEILGLFLDCLGSLEHDGFDLVYWFYDDNDNEASSEELARFVRSRGATVLPPLELGKTDYDRTGSTHFWSPTGISRVADIKNAAIKAFLATESTHLMLVDADVLVPPPLVRHLLSLQLPVVSEVYWTRWRPDQPYLPNVWDTDAYQFAGPKSLLQLKTPGQYQVTGLGACTLVDREVLESGVDFRSVVGLTWAGEDRHFCMRCNARDIPLIADTCHPPFHVYRPELLRDAYRWIRDERSPSWFAENWIDEAWEEHVRSIWAPAGS